MKRKRKLSLSVENAARQREIARYLKRGLPLTGLLAAALFCGADKASAGSCPAPGSSVPSPEAMDTGDATAIFESDVNRCAWSLFFAMPMGIVEMPRAPMSYDKWAARIRKGMKTQLAVLEKQERSGKVEDARRSLELMVRGFDCLVTCESRYGSEAAKTLCREMRRGYMILALGGEDKMGAKLRGEIEKACRTIVGCGSEMPEKNEKALEKVLDAAIERNVREMRDDITNAMRERLNEEVSTGGKISRDEMPEYPALREKLAAWREELEAERKKTKKDDAGNRIGEKDK